MCSSDLGNGEEEEAGRWAGVSSELVPVLMLMETGKTYSGACKELGVSPSLAWRKNSGNTANQIALTRARTRAAHIIADDTMDMVDKVRHRDDVDPVRAAESAARYRQWWCSKADPEVYGDRAAQQSTTVQVGVMLSDLSRIEP